jgi:hypothetical protein
MGRHLLNDALARITAQGECFADKDAVEREKPVRA